jgi:uncharacterized protein (TIGR02391 family)
MPAAPRLSAGQLEQVSRVLGELSSGSDITRLFHTLNIEDASGESTKWRRLYATFDKHQHADRAASKLIDYVQASLDPAAWVHRAAEFDAARSQLNTILAFSGLHFEANGRFAVVQPVSTIDEAHDRAKTLRAKFSGRRIHVEVTKYCAPELLQDNYFHAVFEATKGLAQRIRDLSGIQTDGAALVDAVFSIDRPLLALNTLRTETEKSEHKGFAQLLKGCFAAVRNPLAHEPKILWKGEDDAADYLSLISLLHRKLDDCIQTGLAAKP